jgi:hypothetical protein
MKKYTKNLDSFVASLRRLEDTGVLEPGQFKHAERAVKALRHALKVGDLKRARDAVNDLAKVFLRDDR